MKLMVYDIYSTTFCVLLSCRCSLGHCSHLNIILDKVNPCVFNPSVCSSDRFESGTLVQVDTLKLFVTFPGSFCQHAMFCLGGQCHRCVDGLFVSFTVASTWMSGYRVEYCTVMRWSMFNGQCGQRRG